MSSIFTSIIQMQRPSSAENAPRFERVAQRLTEDLAAPVAVWDAESGELLQRGAGAIGDDLLIPALLRSIGRCDAPQFVADLGGVKLLALPMVGDEGPPAVATAFFVTGEIGPDEAPDAAILAGMSLDDLHAWARGQIRWNAEALLRMAKAIVREWSAELRAERAEHEIDLVSENLARTYEEISLLYTVTQNLRISSTDEDLGSLALDRLEECLPAESFAIQFLAVTTAEDATGNARNEPLFLCSPGCPVNETEFTRLIAHLKLKPGGGPYVANRRVTESVDWQVPSVRQIIVVPLVEGENIFGWLAAFNHRRDESFGTVESNLLASLGTLLGIHCGNRDLYRQQSELLQNIVRALVSAIDAKDPYTSGHSDRVAQFAVRIAHEMNCDPKMINTIYMAGLLHDVGKIGIDDQVLRKAGRLTDVEFEHIKRHPELGHKILADLKQLADILPAVLHHHERWDGLGYPFGLHGKQIPEIARIMAVADSYDAMTSDRPYRSGLPVEKVYQIFRDEAGQYWDPDVIEAFFRVKEEIRSISERERAQIDTLQQQLI